MYSKVQVEYRVGWVVVATICESGQCSRLGKCQNNTFRQLSYSNRPACSERGSGEYHVLEVHVDDECKSSSPQFLIVGFKVKVMR